MIPVSTSPDPAVARTGPPVGLIRTTPSGVATSVRLPFNNVTASVRSARARTCARRSSASSRADTPERRTNSPTCGVRIASDLRSAISAARPANAFSPSASRTIGTGQSRTNSPDEIRGLLVRGQARADRERVGTLEPLEERGQRGHRDGARGRLGQRQEGRLHQSGLHDRQDALRDRDLDETRADPPRRRRDQAGGSRHVARAGDDDEHAGRPLVGVDLRAREGRRSRRRAPSGTPRPRSRSDGNPMSATRTAPANSAPGSTTTPTLGAPNVTVRSARTASPSTAPVAPFTPDGMSTATTGAGDAFSPAIASAQSSSGMPRNPVPNSASIATSARRKLAVERRVRRTAPPGSTATSSSRAAFVAAGSRRSSSGLDGDDADPHAPPREMPGRDQPVAAVVALPAHDDGAPAVRPAHDVDGGARDGASRSFHQGFVGDAAPPATPGRAPTPDRG